MKLLILTLLLSSAPAHLYTVDMEYYNDIPSIAGTGAFYDGDTNIYNINDPILINEARYSVTLYDNNTANRADDIIVEYNLKEVL